MCRRSWLQPKIVLFIRIVSFSHLNNINDVGGSGNDGIKREANQMEKAATW